MFRTVACRRASWMSLMLLLSVGSVAKADFAPLGCVTAAEAELAQLIDG